ncbi:MAG: hypothetical protein PHC75_08170 [Burkholderiales bacterium]|nr:hypothetical protein [Burkholderiales bacterium]
MESISLNEQLAIISVEGADAATYLQGQLTNDIKELDTNKFQLSAHLNTKGRILANFIITKTNENQYYLITDKNNAEKILPRIKMFVLRSKVTINILDINISLDNAANEELIQIEIAANKYITIGNSNLPNTTNANNWHKLLVENSLPFIYPESAEKIIPQQINFEIIGGVNFKKGCYTGQEIVARTHYLGKVKRRLVKFTTGNMPAIGNQVFSPTIDNQEVGFIVDYYEEDGKFMGLASLQLDYINDTYLDVEQKHKLEECKLTHEIPVK